MHQHQFSLFVSIIIFIASCSPSSARENLTPANPLTDGETLVSPGEKFALGFFNPPGSPYRYVGIWYYKIRVQTVVWVANRNTPIHDDSGELSLARNGTLTLTVNNSVVIWSVAPPAGTVSDPAAQVLDSGNFVVSGDDGGFAWQSFDHPTDTLLPGMKLGWDLNSGLNRNLTAWVDASNPAPGPYTMAMDIHGVPQIFLWSGSVRTWRTGPWNGVRFSGIPEMQTYSMFNFSFIRNSDEVYYMFNVRDDSVVSRLIVNQSGSTQRFVWLNQPGIWNLFWFAPKDQCDVVSPCGPNGLCNPNTSPICSCLQGFGPKNPANWDLRDGSDGCSRKTMLDCVNRTDGFMTVNGAKLPDTSSAVVNMAMTMDQCYTACLTNCSCTAYAPANISGGDGAGSGCIMWNTELADLRLYMYGGQQLYVRLAAADLARDGGSSGGGASTVGIIVGAVLGTLLLSLLGCLVWRRKKRRRRHAILGTVSFSNQLNNEKKGDKDIEMPLFDFETIVAATHNFSVDKKLGEGGFGPVYKGELAEGQEIAVKRLATTSIQGLDEFKNEVILIVKLQHRNLVRLLGCCIQGEERMLIYEYMPNKSLDNFLFDKTKRESLDWQTRYKIISGIARGLLYLHQDSRFRIIHRDLKASNILLDKEMNPKISDFGMARIFGGEETEVNTRKVVGTFGYMSPEYAMDGIFSVKSDVFSFGVLVLEIISGKRNRGVYLSDPNLNLLGLAWALWKEGRAMELADESISSYNLPEVMRCIKVGLLCVQERPEDRPLMASVVLMLGSESVFLPNPKQPGYVATRAPIGWESSSSKQESLSVNDISVTMVEGR